MSEEMNSIIQDLKKDAFRLRERIEKISDRKKKELAQLEHAKLISRIEEIEKPTPLRMIRYE